MAEWAEEVNQVLAGFFDDTGRAVYVVLCLRDRRIEAIKEDFDVDYVVVSCPCASGFLVVFEEQPGTGNRFERTTKTSSV